MMILLHDKTRVTVKTFGPEAIIMTHRVCLFKTTVRELTHLATSIIYPLLWDCVQLHTCRSVEILKAKGCWVNVTPELLIEPFSSSTVSYW